MAPPEIKSSRLVSARHGECEFKTPTRYELSAPEPDRMEAWLEWEDGAPAECHSVAELEVVIVDQLGGTVTLTVACEAREWAKLPGVRPFRWQQRFVVCGSMRVGEAPAAIIGGDRGA